MLPVTPPASITTRPKGLEPPFSIYDVPGRSRGRYERNQDAAGRIRTLMCPLPFQQVRSLSGYDGISKWGHEDSNLDPLGKGQFH